MIKSIKDVLKQIVNYEWNDENPSQAQLDDIAELKAWGESIISTCEWTFHGGEQDELETVSGINDLYNAISAVSVDRVRSQIK